MKKVAEGFHDKYVFKGDENRFGRRARCFFHDRANKAIASEVMDCCLLLKEGVRLKDTSYGLQEIRLQVLSAENPGIDPR